MLRHDRTSHYNKFGFLLTGVLVSVGCSSESGGKTAPLNGSAEAGTDGPSLDGTTCKPLTCLQVGAECGSALDGCGGVVSCGACASPKQCGGAGPNKCGEQVCTPKTCSQSGAQCGQIHDGCGTILACGICPLGQTCGGAGPNKCGDQTCLSKTCAQLGAACGQVSDNCGTLLWCGSCPPGQTCGGNGQPNSCVSLDGGSEASTPVGTSLPGRVQAEDYRQGGEGDAFHDTTPGNEGNVYRTDDVDLRACNDVGGGYVVWWTEVGEWLTYNVNVTKADAYQVVLRVAQGDASSRLHLEIDNVDVTGPIDIANTGSWTENFADVKKSDVVLPAGAHVLKVVWDATPGPDLNYIDFLAAVPGCGNSVVEQGEQCDGGDCCDGACHFKAAGAECRAAAGECDVAETCSGTAADCPTNAFKPDTTACSTGTCQAGVCSGASKELVGWGVCFHPEGSPDLAYDRMAQANISVARFDLKWAAVEQQIGQYDFSFYDGVFAKLAAKGIRAYAILDYNNPVYGGGEMNGIVDDYHRDGFVAFAQAAAAHFKNKNTIWEVWNEPNLGMPFWQPVEDAHQYTLLVKAVYPVVKAADPTATVVGPATAFVANFASFFQACVDEGLLDFLDAVSTHPYKDQAPESGAVDQIYDVYRTIMKNAGHEDRPLIAGEIGYSATWLGNSTQMQAKYDLRHLLFSVHKGVRLWMKYDLINDGTDPANSEHNFGLLNNDLSPKPSYDAYKLMTTKLEGTQFDQSLSAGTGNYVLRWKGPNKTAYAYWTSGSNNQKTVDGQSFAFTDTVQYLTIP